ncbi:MAG: hypothetical protein NC212_08400 [Staphylococcus sp.]|nr:hypothetical protein [Staphylococcus sp.]
MKGQKTGGRQKGTPNKDNPLKGYLRSHSLSYFEPRPQLNPDGSPRVIILADNETKITLVDPDGQPMNISDFDADMLLLSPADRVSAELRLLKFHTPEMKSVDMDMTVTDNSESIIDRLSGLMSE